MDVYMQRKNNYTNDYLMIDWHQYYNFLLQKFWKFCFIDSNIVSIDIRFEGWNKAFIFPTSNFRYK